MIDKLRELYYRVMYGRLVQAMIICDSSSAEAAHEFRVASMQYLSGRAEALQAPISIEQTEDTGGALFVLEFWHGGIFTFIKGYGCLDVDTLEPVLSA